MKRARPAHRRTVALLVACAALAAARAADPGDEGPLPLPELTITAARPPPERAAAFTPALAANRLQSLPGLQLRPQGLPEGQVDLSIRGSSFSGAGLAVAGLALRNPQTEHFHAELPLSPLLFAAPARATGLDQARAGTGFLVGTLAYDFLPVEPRVALEAGVAEAGRDWQGLLLQAPLARTPQPLAPGLSLFATRENAARTDGLPANGLDRWNGGAHLQLRSPAQQTDLVAASGRKRFGAQGYYGAPASLPSEEELSDRLLLATSRWSRGDDGFVRGGLVWRQLEDEYWLDRTRPWLYANRHRSRLLSVQADGREPLSDGAALGWRLAAEQERLDSSYAGTLPSSGLGEHRRERAELMFLPELARGPWRLSLGGCAVAFSADRPAWLPLAGIEYRASERHTVYAAYAETVRQPSYTELNYDSPGSLGDQGLERQHDRSLELGWRGHTAESRWQWRSALFATRSENSVDWLRSAGGTRWLATNLHTVDIVGVEAEGRWRPGGTLDLGLAYTGLLKRADESVYASRYVLDYPEHRLMASLVLALPSDWEVRLSQGVTVQTHNPARDSGRTDWPAAAELRIPLPRVPGRATLVLGVENLWDSAFEVYPGQPPAPRRVSLAVAAEW